MVMTVFEKNCIWSQDVVSASIEKTNMGKVELRYRQDLGYPSPNERTVLEVPGYSHISKVYFDGIPVYPFEETK